MMVAEEEILRVRGQPPEGDSSTPSERVPGLVNGNGEEAIYAPNAVEEGAERATCYALEGVFPLRHQTWCRG